MEIEEKQFMKKNLKLNKCLCLLTSLLLLMLNIVGCGEQETPVGKTYQVSYINKECTRVITNDYVVTATNPHEILNELVKELETTPEKLEYNPPLSGSFTLLNMEVNNGELVMDFDENYLKLPATTEVLTRAAVVRTLTQIDGIDCVTFTVAGEPLADQLGKPVGTMTADQFIDNAGKEINSYEKAKLNLYFANEDGTGLIETYRTIAYNSNISMEKLVVEQLISGPNIAEVFPTINPDTKIVSVTVKDGICYVNLDDQFLTQIYNVSADVTIYSIANSLAELPNVNKVQISVNGETDLLYRESVSLTTFFERNLELVASPNN